MTALMDGHIRIDERGVPYVGNTRLKLIHLVMAYLGENGSIKGAREAYDWLSEADLYGALAYYHDHRQEVELAIRDYHERSEKAREAAGESDISRRLHATRAR